jgi:hypothetical protein
MKLLKIALLVLGGLGVLSGLLFLAQGTGIFPYPRDSLMISQTPWVYRGAGIAALSAGVIFFASRL